MIYEINEVDCNKNNEDYKTTEIGEEILVGHESQNAEKPFVLGTHYNGSETSGYHTGENDKKVIHTRSGTKIILNDAEGNVFIEGSSGNTYLMDGAGSINMNAPKNMMFTAGENVTITAGMNITSTAVMNIIESAGMNISMTANVSFYQTATVDYSLMAVNITQFAKKEFMSQSEILTKTSGKIQTMATAGNIIFNAKDAIKDDAGEQSNSH